MEPTPRQAISTWCTRIRTASRSSTAMALKCCCAVIVRTESIFGLLRSRNPYRPTPAPLSNGIRIGEGLAPMVKSGGCDRTRSGAIHAIRRDNSWHARQVNLHYNQQTAGTTYLQLRRTRGNGSAAFTVQARWYVPVTPRPNAKGPNHSESAYRRR